MRRALQLAARGRATTSPNPRVGCVFVKDGVQLARGWHVFAGGEHAELNAINRCRDKRQLRGASVYVNLEPCCHQGRTPPCVDLLIRHKVGRVFIAMRDPNPAVNGKGIAALTAAGIDTQVGLLARQAVHLNRGYIKRHTQGLPWVQLKIAQTRDGGMLVRPRITAQLPPADDRVAAATEAGKPNGDYGPAGMPGADNSVAAPLATSSANSNGADTAAESSAEHYPHAPQPRVRWITGRPARVDVHHLRAQSCAVLSGAASIGYDNSKLNVRINPDNLSYNIRQPIRIALDPHFKLNPQLKFFATRGPKLWAGLTGQSPPRPLPPQTEVLHLPPAADGRGLDLKQLLQELARREINHLMVESGPRLIKSFIKEGLVDELTIYVARPWDPSRVDLSVNSGMQVNAELTAIKFTDPTSPAEFALEQSRVYGDDTRLSFRRQPS